MKKIASFILVLVIIVEAYMIFPITGVSASEVNNRIDFPTYQAEIIDKGYDGNDGYYDLLKSMKEPLYYDFTEYMLDDEVLCWTSNFWNSAFNQDFKSNPSYFYEVILMGFLKFDQHQIDTSGVWNSSEMSLSVGIYNKLIDKYVDVLENPTTEKYYNYIKNLSVGEVENAVSQIDDLKLSKDAIKYASKGAKYVTEFVKRLSDYQNLLEAKEQRIEMLKLAKENVKDNEYFTKAVDDIINFMNKTEIEYVSDKTAQKMWCDFIDNLWKSIIKASPIGIVLEAIDIEKIALDVLFNSSDTASNNFKLLVLYIVDTYFSSSLKSSYENYKKTGSFGDSCTLVQCYRSYIEYQIYGLDYTKTFIDDIVDNGGIHSIVEQIFFKDNVKNASELKEFCNNQANNRKRLLELLDKAVNSYYHTNGFDELVEVISSSDKLENVSVTGISFSENESTINGTEDICLVYANVYPENATNKKVTYTSSDPSILSVPTSGGFATPNRKGSVIVTATTEDGNFVATKKINVNFDPNNQNKKLSVINKGKCGEHAYWKLYSNGTLYITGTGEIYGYYGQECWGRNHSIKKIIVSSGISCIGKYSFYGCDGITDIVLPSSVKEIGYCAFECTLEGIVLNKTIYYHGTRKQFKNIKIDNTYYGNAELLNADEHYINNDYEYEFQLKNGVESVAIYNTTSENHELVIPNIIEDCKVTTILDNAFINNSSLIKVSIPSNINVIKDAAFANCKNLNCVTVSGRFKEVSNIAFANSPVEVLKIFPKTSTLHSDMVVCRDTIKKVIISDNITVIASAAFANCKNLNNVSIPNSVSSIGSSAFENCENLNKIDIPEGVINIPDEAFKNCSNLASLSLPSSLEKIDDYAYEGCSKLSEFVAPTNLKRIGKNAFKDCTNIKSVTTAKNLFYVDSEAFSSCPIETFIIPKNISEIDWRTVFCRDKIKTIIILDGVISIGKNAFEKCINLENVNFPNSIISLGSNSFADCSNLSKVTLPDNIKKIEYSVFENCINLRSVKLPLIINEIPDSLFYNCSSLESVVLPNSVSIIGNSAFSKCTKLNQVNIPENVTEIQWNAFEYCSSLKEILIPKSVTHIYDGAFQHCSGLQKVTISDSIKDTNTLVEKVFKDCKIKELVFSNGTTTINENMVFCRDSLEKIFIPNSVTGIDKRSFRSCSLITSVDIPSSVEKIGDESFIGCTGLESIDVDPKNKNYSSIDGVLFDKNITELIKYPSNKSECLYSMPNSVEIIGPYSFSYCPQLKSLTFSDKVKFIDDFSIEFCKNLDTICISDDIQEVGSYAFYDCNNINNVVIKNGTKVITSEMINYNYDFLDNVKRIQIPESVEDIDVSFYSLKYLEEIVVDNKNITYSSYNGILYNFEKSNIVCYPPNKKDKTFILPSSVKKVEYGTWIGCNNLEKIILSKNVNLFFGDSLEECPKLKIIGVDYNNMYYTSKGSILYNKKMTRLIKCPEGLISDSLTIPENVLYIDDYAFSKCKKIKKIIFSKTIKSIANYAFDDTNNITICGYQGTVAEKYAKIHNMKFEKIATNKKTTISLKKSTTNLYVKGNEKIIVTIKNGIGKTTYKSSNSNIARVDKNGKVYALKAGTVRITVTNNKISRYFTVKVSNPRLNKTTVSLKRGKSYTLKITGQVGVASYKSANTKIAVVNSKGLIKINKKAKVGFKTYISVKTNGITLKCIVKVVK